MQKVIGFKEEETLLDSFVYSNFDYCPLLLHFYSTKSVKRWKKYKSEFLENFATTFEEIMSLS